MQASGRRDIDRHHLSLRPAQRRYEVVGGKRVAYVRGAYSVGSHLVRIKPGPQGKFLLAQNLGRLNAFHCL